MLSAGQVQSLRHRSRMTRHPSRIVENRKAVVSPDQKSDSSLERAQKTADSATSRDRGTVGSYDAK